MEGKKSSLALLQNQLTIERDIDKRIFITIVVLFNGKANTFYNILKALLLVYLTVRYIFVTCFAQVPNKIHIFSWKEARSAQESRKIPPSVFKLIHNSWHKYMPYINQQMPLDLSSALISTIGYSRQRGKYSSIIIMFCTIREEYLDLLLWIQN